ncbi:MAG: hypothetical protein HY677_05715 [Chloroflexi bacterium]|nr:hypothetical protein [Chloroflexota bacterium]
MRRFFFVGRIDRRLSSVCSALRSHGKMALRRPDGVRNLARLVRVAWWLGGLDVGQGEHGQTKTRQDRWG